ncbi:cell envelope integrity protein TolA [Hydrogenophaga sp. SL48]|uniref:cell envelope integrity protein TolA n=1 Tax=Hydrogenophaga sp. SL48 TaxID=2806347 RepID=UPI001F01B1D6|nr:cell envelope integrity protein TolA [Hydrogenophaga sp. SL48]UJW82194.1 cell envelope integrity protein TolA [Hydrogenophaga sp. SL48]
MQVTTDALDLKPPRSGRWTVPVGLALVAHALLMAALTWGVHWKKDEEPVSFEAELWSAVPREAAPRAVQPPPPPPPPPEPEAKPEPKPAPRPEPKPAPPPPEPVVKQADIATAQKKKQEEKKRELEEKRAEELKKKAEEKRQEALERKQEEKKLADAKKKEDAKKQAEKKLQEQKLQAERERKAEAAAKADREDQMRRIMGQAGASGGPEARGSAQQSSGPSSGYGSKVAARIRPNIRYTEDFPRSLRTEIEVRALSDGTITSRRVVDSSGNAAWDDAALKAIDRTGSLPRDVDGRVPSPIIVVVRPTD